MAARVAADDLSVAVLGLGSRGVGVLERIAALAADPRRADRRVLVHLVDPVADGCGLHRPDQPDYLLLNTVAGEISLFAEPASVGAAVGEAGPDLLTWATGRGLRIGADGYTLGTEGRQIRSDDYLPRRLLGEYLAWFLARLLAGVGDNVTVRIHQATAVDLTQNAQGGYKVLLDDGTVLGVGNVFVTTGHCGAVPEHGPGPRHRVLGPYPLPGRLAEIPQGGRVALAGSGLTGMDVLASLTLGRGGRYLRGQSGLRYRPSGAEPRIVLFTRTGLPFNARPRNNRDRPAPAPVVFTATAVDRLRARDGGGISLHEDLVPLLLAEMSVAFHLRCAALDDGADGEADLAEQLAAAHAAGALDSLLAVLDEKHEAVHGRFEPRSALFPAVAERSSGPAYQSWYTDRIARDLAEADRGVAASPVKAALEVLRDRRELIRRAVGLGGLDDRSHQEFYRSFTGTLNRAVTGPQLDRHAELLALIESGVVRVPFGPAPLCVWDESAGAWQISSTALAQPHAEHADWLVCSTSAQPGPADTTNPLLRSLLERGLARGHRAHLPGSRGVDLTADHRVIDEHGSARQGLWVLGPPAEGTTFYNHYVPSPGGFCRATADAHRAVSDMFEAAESDHTQENE
jgi:uncharacterized NAD(P)/FAD-binding protein YdhS